MDILSLLRWQIAHTTNMAHISTPKIDGISSVHGSLGTPTLDSNLRATSRRFGATWATVKKPPTQVIKLAELSLLQKREAPRLQQGLPGTKGLPQRLRPMGGPMGGGSGVVDSRGPPTQQPSPRRSTFSMRWVALATLFLVA